MEYAQEIPTGAKKQDSSRAAPAPAIYAAVLLVGVLVSLAFPVSFLPRSVTWIAGGACVLLPFLLGFAALGAMRHAKTSVNPYRPTTALLFNALWAIVLLPVALLIVQYAVIKREEHYLEQTFGEQYLSYKAQVRRWI
jgi:protein-S-isoprenylcysteine O-methyltransferase Ste14